MMRISRRQLSQYVAESLINGKSEVVEQVAAYLLMNGRTKEADLLVRDVEKALESRGVVVAHVRSAHQLDESQRNEIESLLKNKFNAKSVSTKDMVDEDLLGGVVVRTASDEFDGSLRRNINRLKSMKV